jgi:hypothetical protein
VNVKYPEMRAEVIAALDDLAEPYTPNSAEFSTPGPPSSNFDWITGLLLDEMVWEDRPLMHVGGCLKSEDEARALHDLAPFLRAVLDEAGSWETDECYQATSAWPALVEAARETRQRFGPRD